MGTALMDDAGIDITIYGHLVEVKLNGYYSPDRAMRAMSALRRAIGALGERAGHHVTLYDVSTADVSPPETISLMQQAFAESLKMKVAAKRVAYWAPSALLRLQLKRLREGRGDIQVFADRDEALAWLLEKS